MSVRIFLVVLLGGILAMASTGCTMAADKPPIASTHVITVMPNKNNDPQEVQDAIVSFAERYVVAISDAYDRAQTNATTPEGRNAILRLRLLTGMGALGNAVNSNPIVGLMDTAIMVRLRREALDVPALERALGPENHALFKETLSAQEEDVWQLAGKYLTAKQVEELTAVARRWHDAHPNQEVIGGARLGDLPETKENNPEQETADSIFSLVRLDPFAGLDPAVRQLKESRILAERMFFYLRYMPMQVSWQTDLLYNQMISQPETAQLLKDTSAVSANMTKFTTASSDFAEACTNFANTMEAFRKDLPVQQATLVKQVNEMLAAQIDTALKQTNTLRDSTVQQLNETVASVREAAFKQASAETGAQREAAIRQLTEAVTAQQELLAKHMDASIDRLNTALRNLILLAAGALFLVLVAFRVVSRYWLTGKAVRLPEDAGVPKVRA